VQQLRRDRPDRSARRLARAGSVAHQGRAEGVERLGGRGVAVPGAVHDDGEHEVAPALAAGEAGQRADAVERSRLRAHTAARGLGPALARGRDRLTAGLAAFLGSGFYGSVSSGDANGYELYVIASAVVGGARLSGGRGSAINAMLGAVLIVLIRQSIRTLHLDQNYEWIIVGCAIVVAVVLDQASARFAARRLAQGEE